jgi:hypothetical protein
MDSIDDLKDRLNTDDHRLWALIGLCVGLVATLEAVEEAVEGAWPHQRRTSMMPTPERQAHQFWALAAILIVPAGLLALGCVGMMVWKDVPRTEEMNTGFILLGIGWVMFMLASIDRLRFRVLISRAGPVVPLAVAVTLLAAVALLLSAFWEIKPTIDMIRESVPLLGESD